MMLRRYKTGGRAVTQLDLLKSEARISKGRLPAGVLALGPALPYQAAFAFSALLAVALLAFMAARLK